jgi:hypothetical protein
MITITVDLSAATPEEAHAYFSSQLRASLLDNRCSDLQGCDLQIAMHEAPYIAPELEAYFAAFQAGAVQRTG